MMASALSRRTGSPARTAVFVTVLLAFGTTIALVGCSGAASNDLTREQAKALIATSADFPLRKTTRVPVMVQISDLDTMPTLRRIEHAGAIKLTKINQPYEVFPIYQIKITDAGRKYQVENQEAAKAREVEVLVCELDLGDVTGIAASADEMKADVHFNVVIKDVSPFAIMVQGPCHIPESAIAPKAIPHIANMSLFDDGWRVVKVTAEGGGRQ